MSIMNWLKDHLSVCVFFMTLTLGAGGSWHKFNTMTESVHTLVSTQTDLKFKVQELSITQKSNTEDVSSLRSITNDLIREQQKIQRETNKLLADIQTRLSVQESKVESVLERLK